MRALLQFLNTPWAGGIIVLVVKAAIGAMPGPLSGGSRFYLWLYGFVQLMVMNLEKTTISLQAVPTQDATAVPPAPAPPTQAAPAVAVKP